MSFDLFIKIARLPPYSPCGILAPILIVMDTDETDELGVDMLTYDNILKLLEIADRYNKILLVINDLPFSAKRKP